MIEFSTGCLFLVALGWLVDRWLGEPVRFHPLVGFGRVATALEQGMRSRFVLTGLTGRLLGLMAVMALLLPLVLLARMVCSCEPLGWVWHVVLLYGALGGKSLEQHALQVYQALDHGDLEQARLRVGYLVSRDTGGMEAPEVARATVESVLENGCDAVFGALFWFMLLGGPGVLLFRLANTLDAMWGYRNDRFYYFGWAAARLDDLLGLVPARLTALTYGVVGHSRGAISAWRRCTQRKSPNATLVMATGGGALGVRLGGGGIYHGQWQAAPELGGERTPEAQDILGAVRLVTWGGGVWVIVSFILGVVVVATVS